MALCYLDRTFCSSDCVNRKCYNNRHPGTEEKAERFGLPMAVANLREHCDAYVAPETNDARQD